ncbi:MAG: ComEC/Rec2 family competence protein, partial [Dinoroseobacter sp.]|nr:ComEC/Rec2 family competence protein [Dinoroseobacter sp.]
MKTEPSALLRVLVLILMLVTASLVPLTGRKLPWAWRAPLLGLATLLAGFTLAAWRAHDVAAPVLSFRYYGPIEGRIVAIDRSRSGAMRLTLDQIGLEDVSSWRTPDRVRVSLHGDQGNVKPEPGQFVAMTGHLSPPGGPSEPGGFDFRRLAWFQSLGAVGYTRKPIALLTPPTSTGWRIWLYTLRLSLSNAISSRIEGPEGGFAAAILTGDRAGLDPDHVRNLRHSNLAHLLAISGLHMGLLTGAVFFALRAAFAIVPMIALTYPIKKFAALGALIAAFSYLHLSGASVATERAFIMASL